jgi:hypothetical protein
MTEQLRRRLTATATTMTLFASFIVAAPTALAASVIGVTTTNQEINGDDFCSLQEAIYSANLDDNVAPDPADPSQMLDTGCVAGDGADTIWLPPSGVSTLADPITDPDNFVGPSATPIVTSTIVIEGFGARLQRHPLGRLTRAFVVGPTGDLTLHEVHIKGFGTRGGDGVGGSGGGMGAGGAVYVQGGALAVGWSTFEGNSAEGGDGGDEYFGGGGGGGGLYGDGGSPDALGGGGGGGSYGSGGDARGPALESFGGGGGGRVTSGVFETPGEPCGGAGGESLFAFGGDGSMAWCAGGGGGGGAGATDLLPGNGALGLYGGGGGGGGEGADGGDGGFGAGGGGAGLGGHGSGGDGGFGGGGGAGFVAFGEGRGQGGTFGGDGDRAGGGGAALGGAIFGYAATIDIENSTFFGNSVARGHAGIACGLEGCSPGANDGRGAGGAIFTVAGALTIDSSTIAGNATGEYNETADGPEGLGGGGIVVYDPEGNESASLVLRNTIVANNGPFECYTRNGVSIVGSSHNLVTDSNVNSHGDPHCTGVIQSFDPQLQPLALNPPGRTPTMAIPADSSAIDASNPTTSTADDQRGVPRPQGAGPDIGAFEFSGTPPVTTIALDPVTADGSNGWYVGPVAVTVAATDPDGSISQIRCALDPAVVPSAFADLPDVACGISSVEQDGQHTLYAASRDDGGLHSPIVSATFKLDGTPPTLSPTLSATTVQLNQAGVTAAPNASDATSGVATASCGAVDTTSPGDHTVTCTATDNAGNTVSVDAHYLVEYQILGFFSPVPMSKWKAGQTVPVKVALGDAAGNRLSDAAASALAADCRVVFSAAGAQTKADQCMKYAPNHDQFVFNWKIAKRGTGEATVTVTVSYPGSTGTTRLSGVILITR